MLAGPVGAQEVAEIQIMDFAKRPNVISAMKELDAALNTVLADNSLTGSAEQKEKLKAGYYTTQFGAEYKNKNSGKEAAVASFVDSLPDVGAVLQYYYVEVNSNPLGSKHKLDRADDKSAYSAAHAKYHPELRAYLEEQGLYDIFLYRLDGQNVYTCFKELDFIRKISEPVLADTGLAEVVKAVAASTDKNFTKLVDMKPYVFSYELPARFVATGVYEGDVKIGVLVFQLPPGM